MLDFPVTGKFFAAVRRVALVFQMRRLCDGKYEYIDSGIISLRCFRLLTASRKQQKISQQTLQAFFHVLVFTTEMPLHRKAIRKHYANIRMQYIASSHGSCSDSWLLIIIIDSLFLLQT